MNGEQKHADRGQTREICAPSAGNKNLSHRAHKDVAEA